MGKKSTKSTPYKHETFPNAPIVEALLDIRVPKIEPANDRLFDEFSKEVASTFPVRKPRVNLAASIDVTPGLQPRVSAPVAQPLGFIYSDSHQSKVVQARIDGFTFSKLKPYDRWNTLRDEAKHLWEIYYRTVKPASVSRLAVRYINRIQLPLPFRDFKDYIRTGVDLAPGMPAGITELFYRVVIPNPASRGRMKAIVSATLEQPANKLLPYIFDIDVFTEDSMKPDDPTMWKTFGQLRKFKNDIFFNSMTPKARRLFR